MPRSYKAADKRRSQRFELRLTIEEAHEIVSRAISAGISVADFIRKSALGDSAYMQTAAPDKAALIMELNNLNKIGNVLDQIVSSGKFVNNPDQMELLTDTLTGIKNLSGHLIKKLSS
ncbi:hypothetical protein A3860_02470 [Niastella vici]|uniref:Mobilization protein n=1 Tax=Niastella vici TaxID=1703345 RepID=A0A1V9G9N1_9BACT|nr:hypothetical protein [Niastella vici]OQP67244.1 hypothetical protein A3860_02470 [Niastella vici]